MKNKTKNIMAGIMLIMILIFTFVFASSFAKAWDIKAPKETEEEDTFPVDVKDAEGKTPTDFGEFKLTCPTKKETQSETPTTFEAPEIEIDTSCEIEVFDKDSESQGKVEIEIKDKEGKLEGEDGDIEPLEGWDAFLDALSTSTILECWETEDIMGPGKYGAPIKLGKKLVGVTGFKKLLCIYEIILLSESAIRAFSYNKGSGRCFEEQPLPGTEYCKFCNKDYTVCTKERCENVLGACKWVPYEEQDGGVCMAGVCEPTAVPLIKKIETKFYVDTTTLWESPFVSSGCPDINHGCSVNVNKEIFYRVSDIELNIELNQKAKCRYIIDQTGASFEDMETNNFDDNAFYPDKQGVKISLTELELGREHTIYIKCEGTCEQKHDPGFDWNYIRFTYEKKPDQVPPYIIEVIPNPLTDSWSDEKTKEQIKIRLDEAGFCKFSHIGEAEQCGNNLTTEWNDMCSVDLTTKVWNIEQTSHCNQDTEQCCSRPDQYGEVTCYDKYNCGKCYMDVDLDEKYSEIIDWDEIKELSEDPEIADQIPPDMWEQMKGYGMTGTSKVFTYMFRCSDIKGNIMEEDDSYFFIIMTHPPFDMEIEKPIQKTPLWETYDRHPEILVNTSRMTMCKYGIEEWKNYPSNKPQPAEWGEMNYIVEEGYYDTRHEGLVEEELNAEPQGLIHILYARCRDRGGLEEIRDVAFEVLKDIDSPKIIRMYYAGSDLYIETDEESECVFSPDNCDYNFSDGTQFVTVDGFSHTYYWSTDHLYYVKCKDEWDNYPGAVPGRQGLASPRSKYCTAIINPYEVPSV